MIEALAAIARTALPLGIAAKGELIQERVGILNLGIEGQMVLGAYLGWLVSAQSGSLVLGWSCALLVGCVLGAFFWFLIEICECSQHLVGLGLGMLCSGTAMTSFRLLSTTTKALRSPGPIAQSTLVASALAVGLLLVALGFALRRTRLGVSVSIMGDSLRSADLLGVHVRRYRLLAACTGVALASIAGATLSTCVTRSFAVGIVSGRGWVALALVILGRWSPFGLILACLCWACVDVFQLNAQVSGLQVSSPLLSMAPYVVAIAAVAIFGTRDKAPRMLLQTYRREDDAA